MVYTAPTTVVQETAPVTYTSTTAPLTSAPSMIAYAPGTVITSNAPVATTTVVDTAVTAPAKPAATTTETVPTKVDKGRSCAEDQPEPFFVMCIATDAIARPLRAITR